MGFTEHSLPCPQDIMSTCQRVHTKSPRRSRWRNHGVQTQVCGAPVLHQSLRLRTRVAAMSLGEDRDRSSGLKYLDACFEMPLPGAGLNLYSLQLGLRSAEQCLALLGVSIELPRTHSPSPWKHRGKRGAPGNTCLSLGGWVCRKACQLPLTCLDCGTDLVPLPSRTGPCLFFSPREEGPVYLQHTLASSEHSDKEHYCLLNTLIFSQHIKECSSVTSLSGGIDHLPNS